MSTESPAAPGRSGRRPGKPDTREAILGSARKLLAENGYAGTSMRAIARDAEVDAALVVHYFKTKDGVLREALIPCEARALCTEEIVAGPVEHLGERIVRRFLCDLDEAAGQPQLMRDVLDMGMDFELGAGLIRDVFANHWTAPLAAALACVSEIAEPELAAQLATAQIVGLVIALKCPSFRELHDLDRDGLVRRYGTLVQAALTSV